MLKLRTKKLLVVDSMWQRVFVQSKVNGACYLGDELPSRQVKWSDETWFQQRLRQVRESEKENGSE